MFDVWLQESAPAASLISRLLILNVRVICWPDGPDSGTLRLAIT